MEYYIQLRDGGVQLFLNDAAYINAFVFIFMIQDYTRLLSPTDFTRSYEGESVNNNKTTLKSCIYDEK